MTNVLIVEDEQAIRRFLRTALEADGLRVYEAETLQRGLLEAATRKPDLIILDLGLPDGDGIDFIRDLRQWSAIPVIVLSARSEESDKIAALDAGADDYLVKPFDLSELSARIAAVARRYSGNPNPQIQLGELCINVSDRTIRRDDKLIDLSAREWALFEALLRRPAALLSKSQLEEHLYEFGAEIESNTIEVYISRLRKKLGAHTIEPVRGVGYRLGSA